MKGGAESPPCFNCAWYDVASFGGGVSFVLVLFSQGGSHPRSFVRSLGIGSHGMSDGGIKDVLSGEIRMCGVDIKDSVFCVCAVQEMGGVWVGQRVPG